LKTQISNLQYQHSTAKQTIQDIDIVYYAKQKGIQLTDDQINVLKAVTTNQPCIVNSAHSIGKTMLCAVLAAWFFETKYNGIGLVTAPTNAQITSVFFRQLRAILPNNKWFAPKANRLYKNSNWWIQGVSPANPEAWQGKHNALGGILILIDECHGVDQVFFERALTMFEAGRKDHFFLCTGNPYSKSSGAYLESLKPIYKTMHISALTHPNILQKKEVVPGAISYENVINRIKHECRKAESGEEHKAFQFEDQLLVSENPLFDTAILGQYPGTASFSLFSEEDLYNLRQPIEDNRDYAVVIGCDPARFGSNSSVTIVRRGPNIVEMISNKGVSLTETSERIKQLCRKYCNGSQTDISIPVCVDACGLGVGLIEMAGTGASRYNFIEVLNSSKPTEIIEERVINRRAELWLAMRNFARRKQLSISMLDQKQQDAIINELRAVEFKVGLNGKIQLEDKTQIMKRLNGFSPDHADALSLACILPQQTFESHF
jgi:hypothetical protein